MTVTSGFASSSQSHLVKQRHIVFDHGRFTDDNGRGVVHQNSSANFCSRVDVDSKRFGDPILQVQRQQFSSLPP